MRFHKKTALGICLIGVWALSGCGGGSMAGTDAASLPAESAEQETVVLSELQPDQIDMTVWQYRQEEDVYWQTGIAYCTSPADEDYETLGIYVPAKYMNGTPNGDGTYTCEINPDGTVGEYTAENAPIVIPVETPGYAAMAAPTEYVTGTAAYTDEGFIYVYAGCRGRDAGAPAGVTDLKAAIRYIRYNEAVIPGSMERIFSFGMSGGGAQSALLGTTGDSGLYLPYLEAIGAVMETSDAVTGSMCWCPITNLDYASEAYEWNLGVTRTGLTQDMQKLSDAMAEQFALYINQLGLQDENGVNLSLTASEEGIYQAGSYYDYLKNVVEASLNNFLTDTEFPYTAAGGRNGGFGGPDGRGGKGDFDGPDGMKEDFGGPDDIEGDFGGPDGRGGKGDFGGPEGIEGDFGGPDDIEGDFGGPDGLDGKKRETAGEGLPEENGIYARDGIARNKTDGGLSISGTYETAWDYVNALNEQTEWVHYDSATNTAIITGIADFVKALKVASKDLGAFDALDESQGENILFGDGDGMGDHFDSVMAGLLADSEYAGAFAEDMLRTDAVGNSVEERVNMYTPLYYLSDYYEGYGTATVAPFFRIRSGINQSDTALTTEVNLALALKSYGVDVDFETVWGQAHVEAERTGDSTSNFIEWVKECCGKS